MLTTNVATGAQKCLVGLAFFTFHPGYEQSVLRRYTPFLLNLRRFVLLSRKNDSRADVPHQVAAGCLPLTALIAACPSVVGALRTLPSRTKSEFCLWPTYSHFSSRHRFFFSIGRKALLRYHPARRVPSRIYLSGAILSNIRWN